MSNICFTIVLLTVCKLAEVRELKLQHFIQKDKLKKERENEQ